jgi:hypothetical protein
VNETKSHFGGQAQQAVKMAGLPVFGARFTFPGRFSQFAASNGPYWHRM